jgi:hypothetical protein
MWDRNLLNFRMKLFILILFYWIKEFSLIIIKDLVFFDEKNIIEKLDII